MLSRFGIEPMTVELMHIKVTTTRGVLVNVRNISYKFVAENLFQSIQGKTLNLNHKLANANSESKVVGSTPKFAKSQHDFSGFSPEFCMGGNDTNGGVLILLCPRFCFVVLFIHSD